MYSRSCFESNCFLNVAHAYASILFISEGTVLASINTPSSTKVSIIAYSAVKALRLSALYSRSLISMLGDIGGEDVFS